MSPRTIWCFSPGALGNAPGVAAVEGDVATQTTRTLDNLETVLEAAGIDPSRIVSTNVYVTDTRHYRALGQVIRARAARHLVEASVPAARTVFEADIAVPDAVLEMSVIAARDGFEVTAVTPEGWPTPTTLYSWGVLAGDTLFISGQAGIDISTGTIENNTKAQVGTAIANIDAIVKAAGMTLAEVVGCRVVLPDARDFGAMNEAWRAAFPDAPPTRATVRGKLINPALRAMIQCTAVRGAERKVIGADPAANTPFSPGIQVGNRLYLSGFVGRGPDGYPAGTLAQTHVTLDRLEAMLEAAGMGFEHVIESTVWLSDIRTFPEMNEAYAARIAGPMPARSTVGSQLMSPDALVEIAMIAERVPESNVRSDVEPPSDAP